MMKLGSVFIVDEDAALAVHRGEFRLAAQGNGSRHRSIRRVDRSGVFSASVKREHSLADWLVDNRVRIRIGLDRADGLQRLEIKNRDVVGTAVAGEASTKIRRDCNSVHALGVG